MNFKDWLKIQEEASLKGNEAIPGEGKDKKEPKYLNDVERKANQMISTNGITQRSGSELMRLIPETQRIQIGKEKELEILAEEVIRAHYGSILDNIDLDIKIVKEGSVDMSDEEQEEQDKPSYKLLNDPAVKLEIDRRKLNNNIIQGEAKNTKDILHSEESTSGLTKIFGERNSKVMLQNYDRITKIMNGLDWIIPMEVQERMWKENPQGFAGKVKVEWPDKPKSEDAEDELNKILNNDGDIGNDDETEDFFNTGNPKIVARGVDFPMLLHETVKGIYELIASASIHKDVEIAKTVKLNADELSNELEDLRYGPFIAGDIRDFISSNKDMDKYPNIREHVYGKMNQMQTKEFLELIKGILMKSAKARVDVDNMVSDIIKELDEYELGQHLDMSSSEEEPEYKEREIEDIDLAKLGHVKDNTTTPYDKMSVRELKELIDEYIDNGEFDKIADIQKVIDAR